MSTFHKSALRQFRSDNLKVLQNYQKATLHDIAALLNQIAPLAIKLEEICLIQAPGLKLYTSANDKLFITTILVALQGLVNTEISSRNASQEFPF